MTIKEAPALTNLLEVVRCGCKTGCKTMPCPCRKHGLKCTDSCREYRGVSYPIAKTSISTYLINDEFYFLFF